MAIARKLNINELSPNYLIMDRNNDIRDNAEAVEPG